ncbi:FtsX-like permease family protein [Longispora sp. NPDC051575]|uniref:ABC transporter permease n=1 Tax=Longispora sp. NPDC051575 TaxID=3154943 RepID=UPI003414C41F
MRLLALALRISSRSLRRTPRRSLLLIAFVAVPLTVATLVATLTATAVPTPEEFARRGLGAATLRAELPALGARPPAEALGQGTAKIRELVPGARDIQPVISQDSRLVKGDREVAGSSFGIDGANPMHAGRFTVEKGTLPASDGETALSAAVARRLGVGTGDKVTVDGSELTVSGIVVDRAGTTRTFAVATVPTAVTMAARTTGGEAAGRSKQVTIAWHLAGVDPTTTRRVLQDAGWRTLDRSDFATKGSDQIGQLPALTLGLTALMLALAILLMGAGFAVAASSSRREIGLLAVCGAGPAQRRLVLTCNGLVLGVLATALGLGVGVGLAALAYPRVAASVEQVWTELRVDVPLMVVFGVIGLGGPVLAAWLAGRQVATMDPWVALHERPSATGRAATRRTRRWSVAAVVTAVVVLGLATLAGNLALTALAALVAVIGAAGITRMAVPWLARRADVARPGMRVALRSHAAAPGRGTALIAAIGAVVTVAGLVMLGVGGLTERAASTYRPSSPVGTTVVDTHDTLPGTTISDMARRLDATGVARINLAMPADAVGQNTYLATVENPAAVCYRTPREDPRVCAQRAGFDTSFWYVGIVEPAQLATILGRPLTGAEESAYREGRVLAFSDRIVADGTVRIWDRDPRGARDRQPKLLPAVVASGARIHSDLPFAYLSPESAAAAGFRNHPQVQYVIRSAATPPESAEDAARAMLTADAGGYARLYVERGDPASRNLGTVLMICAVALLALATVVSVLAVALAAGELAPEFATLAAVGATSRFRRGLSAAYSTVTATLGVLLGLAVLAAVSPAQSRAMDVPGSGLAWLMLLGTAVAAVVVSAGGGWLTSPRPVSLVRRVD